ncbi:MAG: hypothetical protein IPM47_03570 [Sphingobacteriales bacterium]|nr:MAG: hypothetical protein IPM47_03570 [Sphingobacteriales bacterium]
MEVKWVKNVSILKKKIAFLLHKIAIFKKKKTIKMSEKTVSLSQKTIKIFYIIILKEKTAIEKIKMMIKAPKIHF